MKSTLSATNHLPRRQMHCDRIEGADRVGLGVRDLDDVVGRSVGEIGTAAVARLLERGL